MLDLQLAAEGVAVQNLRNPLSIPPKFRQRDFSRLFG